ncbi:hypothetical protein B7P43_G15984 [Cryptotermes secundus]|uniref:Gustatory receptor n=1 Tax=Cryptotermes secundus TaxID=105785 RepID=A0A2J7PFJ0_9NEOP|nr:hypothetical protein B7P43_G15984 [Cryptotermes secundus]
MKSDLQAKDIYSALWPLHLLSKIFGLAPYSLKRDNESVTNRSLSNCFCRIWSIFLIILLMVLSYVYNTVNITGNVTLKQKIFEVLFSALMYGYSIISLLLPLTIKKDKAPQIITKISEIDHLFSSKKYKTQIYEKTQLFVIFQISIMTCTVLALMTCGAYVVHGNFSFRNCHYFFVETLPMFINCIVILNFVNVVLLLRDKYKFLNSMLEMSAVKPCNKNVNDFHTNCITPMDNCTFEMKYFSRDRREMNISSRRNQLHNLRIIYSRLHEVAHLINSTFGILLLCTTLWLLISIICGINYVLKTKHTDSSLYVIVAVLWSIFCASLITLMAMSCSLAVNECNRSPVIVQNIMLRQDIDILVTKELKKMFIQFKVMKIEFSACGMYRIDLSLLCGIFGATFSYIIIFWQL